GRIFAELAVTVSAALIFSAVLALSLAPMLCSKLLHTSERENRATHLIDRTFARLSGGYRKALAALLGAPWLAAVFSLCIAWLAYLLLVAIPQEYAPVEDQGAFIATVQAPEGASFEHLAGEAE